MLNKKELDENPEEFLETIGAKLFRLFLAEKAK